METSTKYLNGTSNKILAPCVVLGFPKVLIKYAKIVWKAEAFECLPTLLKLKYLKYLKYNLILYCLGRMLAHYANDRD